MKFGVNGKGKSTININDIIKGKGIPPIENVKPSSEREKRIQQMILTGKGIPPITESNTYSLRLRKRK